MQQTTTTCTYTISVKECLQQFEEVLINCLQSVSMLLELANYYDRILGFIVYANLNVYLLCHQSSQSLNVVYISDLEISFYRFCY